MNGGQRNSNDIDKQMQEIATKMESLKKYNIFDVDMMLSAINHQLDQLNYFYGNLVPKQGGDANKTYYNLKIEPKEHQLIYVALGRGYPKELFDAHWCYVVKNCKTKLLVIPTTSIKETSSIGEADYYYDIIEESGSTSRLRLDEIRMVDKMRVISYKPYRNVSTSRNLIEEKFLEFLKFPSQMIDKSTEV